MMHDIQAVSLPKILYEIGNEFYKAINGGYYSFSVEKTIQENNLLDDQIIKYNVYIQDEDTRCENDDVESLLIFQIDDKNKIVNVNQYFNKLFNFSKESIIDINKWNMYVWGGYLPKPAKKEVG